MITRRCHHPVSGAVCLALTCIVPLSSAGIARAQPGTVLSEQKISDTEGGFSGALGGGDQFGNRVRALGDLDGDGVNDLAVGAPLDDDGGTDHGALWVLFLNFDGTVKSHQKISDTEGGFSGTLGFDDQFGAAIATLGDVDGDGVTERRQG